MESILDLIEILSNLSPFIFILMGYTIGSLSEKKHYLSIKLREKELINLPAVNSKIIENKDNVISAELVTGSAVISIDYFKRFVAILRNIFGGRVSSYESLIDRARREAIIRMKLSAKDADIIVNTRIETSSIGNSANSKGKVGSVEALAYGTAIKYKENTINLDK